MDPLSEVLSLLKPRSYLSSGVDAGGDWAVQFNNQHDTIKCYAIVSGGCWLSVEGVPEPVRLEAGDCFVLPSGRPFRLASDLALVPVDSKTIFPPAHPGGVVRINDGGGLFLTGSRFAVAGSHASLLLGMLPPIVHIRKESEQAALRWSVERMREEMREGQPGGVLIAQHLAHMMLVQALRMHLSDELNGSSRWFVALADKQIGIAIRAIHADPARRWTLQELAEHAGMSRSTFAQKFRETAAETPMEYLSRWRMLLAADKLENSDDPVARIAIALGYESESAFSTAFKRIMGCAPRQFGRSRQPATPPRGATSSVEQAAE
ncbi:MULTISPECIES: AraC family transcriptional regulator [unclassified Chelatococcus]|uniref:AraC family transcriptional regulator n=1 Tax=unclassified Chelatococcus TaxID=2638111 RepID=UPI001BD1B846|nr:MULTISPECIES: AraC family transcriptional regulator [unclassified Chelatococcus]CAH1672870.1 putative AraC-like transcription regulator [Hyphomicrobiales bacterium]MBS7738895.1 AraC family transcriptional regulator [Chelatococcus sp. HY11]MBX3547047.1 AraC family transcriptional regulator [Chelatococcus sp.]MCO5076576.1 AraC family transcriptional regulator [Chelatococcus sp.]CAH1674890.1 putative AraC-like transcription regulator [Hyphomicrobiales bacterium]